MSGYELEETENVRTGKVELRSFRSDIPRDNGISHTVNIDLDDLGYIPFELDGDLFLSARKHREMMTDNLKLSEMTAVLHYQS